jgi:hypothetical protein
MAGDNPLSLTWYWIAGRRPDFKERKKGTSSLGVCIIDGAGPMHANSRAKQMGIHPGGEYKIWELHGPPPAQFCRRLLRNEEARELNLELKETLN